MSACLICLLFPTFQGADFLEMAVSVQLEKEKFTMVRLCLFQIEKLLFRNQSPHKVVTDQAYRLQQGLLLTTTQQQVCE